MAEVQPLDFGTKGSFPWKTIQERMPVILTKVIDQCHHYVRQLLHEDQDESAVAAAQGVVGLLSKLKYEMQTSKPMSAITAHPDDDALSAAALWNSMLDDEATRIREKGKDVDENGVKWYSARWLLAECYLYRRIRSALATSDLMRTFDPFEAQKQQSWHCSMDAISSLADVLSVTCASLGKPDYLDTQRKQATLLLFQFALWGNASDLSLMADFDGAHGSLSDIQADTAEKLVGQERKILVNDFDAVYARLETMRASGQGQLDIVLDNAGFELFTDLCLLHFLTTAGFATKVVLHVKTLPWFVSDTSAKDFAWVVTQLNQSDSSSLAALGKAISGYVETGAWALMEDQFWCLPHDFDAMAATSPGLYETLGKSDLVLFKGDLNYRKLLGDLSWPYTTPFSEACRGFRPAPFCALRTCKANLIAGLAAGQAEVVAVEDGDWLVSGRWAVIQARLD
eukprot:m.488245 g.488245  ORF g.488245 m.488245 type:complete len:455 (-) comp25673_c0_seq1:286-1650(-)